jgi:hypothetical protein
LAENDNGDYIDINPWPAAELVGQLVTSVAVARRGLIESDEESDIFARETDRIELDAWAKLELSAWMTAEDSRILESPIGELSTDQVERCDDAMIVSSTIAWSIRVAYLKALPLLSTGDPEQKTLDWVPGPWTPVRNMIKGVRVRSDESLAAERERWELVYWRCSLFSDDRSFDDDNLALRETVQEVEEVGSIGVAGGDFAMEDGTPFRNLDGQMLEELRHQSELRLRALNWVCGLGETLESAPLFVDD